jgi:hypothetical protein
MVGVVVSTSLIHGASRDFEDHFINAMISGGLLIWWRIRFRRRRQTDIRFRA